MLPLTVDRWMLGVACGISRQSTYVAVPWHLHGAALMGDALPSIQAYSFQGSGLPVSARESIRDQLSGSPLPTESIARTPAVKTHPMCAGNMFLKYILEEGCKQSCPRQRTVDLCACIA